MSEDHNMCVPENVSVQYTRTYIYLKKKHVHLHVFSSLAPVLAYLHALNYHDKL